jgi:putative ABC transport system permease protein
VQPDFLSGIYGGITMAQYHQIQQVPGVQVAAPIAMVGYTQLNALTFEPVPAAALGRSGSRLYRISTTWVSDNGASRVTQPPGYLYVTPRRLTTGPGTAGARSSCGAASFPPPGTNPFGTTAQSYALCWSRVNHNALPTSPGGVDDTAAGYFVEWTVPVLIAAVDPAAEAKLDGLNKAVVSGRYLTEHESGSGPLLPVLASSASGMSEYAQTTVQQLAAPAAKPDMNAAWKSGQASAPGRTVAAVRTTAQQAYNAVLKGPGTASEENYTGTPIAGYWSVGPVDYRLTRAGALAPRQVVNRPAVWDTGSLASVAMDDENSQYRTVTSHVTSNSYLPVALIKITGVFDQARIRSFSPLSRVPLGAYQPVTAVPATAASRRALHGGNLLPSQNLGGLVSQPVNLITTLSALPKLENSADYSHVRAADPISVIRVRVAGVTGPNALSRERVNAVAQQIAQRTGLDVDVVAGSSPSPETIDLPAGRFGPPPLTVSENWV